MGVNVGDDRDYFVRTISAMCAEAVETYRLGCAPPAGSDIEILDGRRARLPTVAT